MKKRRENKLETTELGARARPNHRWMEQMMGGFQGTENLKCRTKDHYKSLGKDGKGEKSRLVNGFGAATKT